MTSVFRRILLKKIDTKKSWDEIAAEAKIPLSTWMTGLPTAQPTDDELRALAPVLETTYKWLKYGD